MLASAHRSAAQRPGHEISRGEAQAPSSFLGPGVGIRGALEIDGELIISGRVKGRISALKLVIEADGYVEGDIIAHTVVITGRLNGRVFAPTVSIEDGAQIDGRIFHTDVTVAKGARVTGRMPWRPASYFETLKKLPEVRP